MNDVHKLYLPAEFIARHDVAAARIRGHFSLGPASCALVPDLDLKLPGIRGRWTALNISAFRALDVFSVASGGVPAGREFRSSGTSAQGRSRSGFSAAGTDAYRLGITSGFKAVLKARGFAGNRGISLIPSPAVWPDSSLASMVDWIAGTMPVKYMESPGSDPGEIHGKSRFREDFRNVSTSSRGPVWLFGTTFHYLPLLEAGALTRLPPGSLAFYTGGTKGRVRDISESHFVEWLAETLGLPAENIVSEYGMSELASAAYTIAGPDRRLRFQSGVIPFVVTGVSPGQGDPATVQGSAEGTGLLGVFDLNRIDIPLPIVTEDVVTLASDGSFRLLGRANTAPLKGCSLLAEGSQPVPEAITPPPAASPTGTGAKPGLRGQSILPVFSRFVASEEAHHALAGAMGSARAAQLALEDLGAAIDPVLSSREKWDRCIKSSGILETGQNLLIIPPNTHPLALAYPLAIALAAGRQVTVKLTRQESAADSFSRLLLRRLGVTGAHVDTVAPGFRLAGQNRWDAVLAFGDDTTISAIKKASGDTILVAGHGEAISVSLAPLENLGQHMSAIIRDTFAMMQRGCMSSRLLGVILPPGSPPGLERIADLVARELAGHWWDTWGEALPAVDSAGLMLRAMEASTKSGVVLKFPGKGLPAVQVTTAAIPATFGPLLNVCPVNAGTTSSEILRLWRSHWPQIKLVTLPAGMVPLESRIDGVEIRSLGAANRPPWNGLHFGEPLFRPS